MVKNPNFPPSTVDVQQGAEHTEYAEQIEEIQRRILEDDDALGVGVGLVNSVAKREVEESRARFYLDGLRDMLEKIEARNASEPGENDGEALKAAWRDMGQLRNLCTEAASSDLSSEGGLAVRCYTEAYRGLQQKLESALNDGVEFSMDTREATKGSGDEVVNDDHVALSETEANDDKKANIEALAEDIHDTIQERLDAMDSLELLNAKITALDRLLDYAGDSESEEYATVSKLLEMVKDIREQEEQLANKLNELEELKQELRSVGSSELQPVVNSHESEDQQTAAPYAGALSRYAELKATAESHGKGLRFKRDGFRVGVTTRARFESELTEAGDQLKEEAVAYVTSITSEKNRRGEYRGSDEEITQQMSDEAFGALRQIMDIEVRQETNRVLVERKESRRFWDKGLAAVGSFLSKGGKWGRRFKGGAPGFMVGLGVTLSHAGWPITSGVVVGATSGVRRGSRLAAIDRNLQEHMDEQGRAKELYTDDAFNLTMEEAKHRAHEDDTTASGIEHLADIMLAESRKASYADGDRVAREANKNARAFGVGAGLGALAGMAWNMLGSDTVSALHGDQSTVEAGNAETGSVNSPEVAGGSDSAVNMEGRNWSDMTPKTESVPVDFSGYDYPWNWAAEQYGPDNAMTKLHELAGKAAQNGNTVSWHGSGESQWLSVNGRTDTGYILETLSRYK